MTAGDNNEHTFDQALSYFHIISGVLGGKEAGTYLAGVVRDVKIQPVKSHLSTLRKPIKWDWNYNIIRQGWLRLLEEAM